MSVVADGEVDIQAKTADSMERYYVQQTRTESKFGENGGNAGGAEKERAECTLDGESRRLSKETVLYTCSATGIRKTLPSNNTD